MHYNNVSSKDIKIMKQWSKLSNEITNVIKTGNQSDISFMLEEAQSGKFRLLTNATTTSPQEGVSGQTDVWYWSLTACGITYGQTSHPNPSPAPNKTHYDSLQSIQNALVADGYHQIQFPWTDYVYLGHDYGKKNLKGMGGCNEGEFRDQNLIYPNPINTNTAVGWYSVQQLNEPNPELNTYDPPTYWWDVYTAIWHYTN